MHLGTSHAPSALKLAGAVGAESMVNTPPPSHRAATDSRIHAIRPTLRPADEMRTLWFIALTRHFGPINIDWLEFAAQRPHRQSGTAGAGFQDEEKCASRVNYVPIEYSCQ